MADPKVEDGGNAGKTAEEIAAQATADEQNLNQDDANNDANPDESGDAGAGGQNLSEADKVNKTNEAQAKFEKDGTWPDDTPDWVKGRINKMTRKVYDEKGRAEKAEQEAARLREENEKLKNTPKELGEKPELGNFDSEEDYFTALSDWNYDKRDQEKAVKNQANKKVTTQQEAKEDFEKKMDSMLNSGQDKHDDFLAKIQGVPGNIFRADVVADIAEAENADDVVYFLADNLTEAAKISEMNPTQRAIAVGQLSARLSAVPTKKASNAPDPIPTGGSKANGPIDDSKLSDKEYFAKKDAERIAKG